MAMDRFIGLHSVEGKQGMQFLTGKIPVPLLKQAF
jgi:hypothetical protein